MVHVKKKFVSPGCSFEFSLARATEPLLLPPTTCLKSQFGFQCGGNSRCNRSSSCSTILESPLDANRALRVFFELLSLKMNNGNRLRARVVVFLVSYLFFFPLSIVRRGAARRRSGGGRAAPRFLQTSALESSSSSPKSIPFTAAVRKPSK